MKTNSEKNSNRLSDDIDPAFLKLAGDVLTACQSYWIGVYRYTNEFMLPYWTAFNAFQTTESDKLVRHHPIESLKDYLELFKFNLQVAEKGMISSLTGMNDYHTATATRALNALLNSIKNGKGENFSTFMAKEAALLDKVVYTYPQAIRAIESEYGFHFEDGGYHKIAETERFTVYQVLPRNGAAVRPNGKPILIIPPYVLGANILAFLPGENKSYAHAYANQGIPTYIRVIKDIDTNPAVQTLTGEDDILDTRFFCERIKAIHGNSVTLNGFCQGGFIAVSGILSGELDGVVDALITCVAPIDGTRSKALIEYMQHLPPRFRDLGYAVKDLPNGNRVVDGKVMSWVYKLKSMEKEAPVHTFYRDLMMFGRNGGMDFKISKTAAAINHWLIYDRNDLPEDITKMSFDSYTIPIGKDGTLPFKLFGRELTFKRLQEKPMPYLICYGKEDDLVDQEAALAPLDFINAEVTGFPKGHGAIATSWSNPQSAFALQKRFEDGSRGPVRFQLDLEEKKNSRLPAKDSLMDRQFLEFWGNYLLSVARGQKQLEDVSRWISGGFSGVDELTALFKKYYGLEEQSQDRPESSAAWERAAEDFKKSFGDYFSIMGWVSKDEYQVLQEENKVLKQKIEAQEETISRLRDLLKNPDIDPGQALDVLQDLINKQNAEFQKLMKKFSEPDK